MVYIRPIACVAVATLGCSSAFGGFMYASSVLEFDQGLRKNGTAVTGDRSDPSNALGEPELTDTVNFVSLGFGGSIVLGFEQSFTNDTVVVWETTYGNPSGYPESAELWVGSGASLETADWDFVTDMSNSEDGLEIALTGVGTGSQTYQFLKLIDSSDPSIHGGSADGYDLDGVRVSAVPTPGSAALAAVSLAIVGRRRRD